MKIYRFFTGLLACTLLWGLAIVVYADDPPKSAQEAANPTSTPPPVEGSSEPVPIQAGERVLDPTTASVTQMELAEDNKSLVPAAPSPLPTPIVKGSDNPFAPAPVTLAEFTGGDLNIVPNSAGRAADLIIGGPAPNNSAGEIGAASSTQIKFEGFEGAFPNNWTTFDNNGGPQHLWGDVNCFPVESNGAWSGWPARRGANGFDPCSGADYPNNIDSWLVFGPFSLADAGSASFDFFFRMISETGTDRLFWGASTNGTNFFGQFASGTYINGPFINGYNFVSLDLSNLAGQPQVWVAITFSSNSSVTFDGPFIDAISLRKNTDARVLLTDENFDVVNFPNAQWDSFDNDGPTNGDFSWNDVPCFSRSGTWSMWPASGGGNALDPCSLNNYPDNARSWVIHGPLNLTGASEAWVDFYVRNVSEACCDSFFWGASINGTNFFGSSISGAHVSGPHFNGYNLIRFNLSNVFTLGDLRGQPTVWIAFVFNSDLSITDQGPFFDDVSVVVEKPQAQPGVNPLFLPVLIKSTTPPAAVFITNNTGGNLVYQILNTPQGTISCNVAIGAQNAPCGPPFTPNVYPWRADSICGSRTGTRLYTSGSNYPTPFGCN